MIIEDEMPALRSMELNMKRQGFEVVCCHDGREAISRMRAENPDVIVANMLPGAALDVVENAKKLVRNVSVIVVAALRQERIVREAFTIGADDFICKPFHFSELVLRIKRLGRLPKTELILSK